MDFFRMAALKGIHVKALDGLPALSPDEHFYLEAYLILSSAGYADISAYCRDHGLTFDERADLIRVILELRSHDRSRKNADS